MNRSFTAMSVVTPPAVLAASIDTPELPASYALPVMVTPRPASVGGISGLCARIRPLMSNDEPARSLITPPSPSSPVLVKRMPTPSGERSPSSTFGPLIRAEFWT